MSTGPTEPEVVDRGQEIRQTLHPLCGRWFSTDYGILWAWMARDGQALWVTRETCDGKGVHVGKISVSKKWLPPLRVARIWRTQRIVMDIDVPGFGRQTPESFVMIQGSTPSGMVLWRAVRKAGSTLPAARLGWSPRPTWSLCRTLKPPRGKRLSPRPSAPGSVGGRTARRGDVSLRGNQKALLL